MQNLKNKGMRTAVASHILCVGFAALSFGTFFMEPSCYSKPLHSASKENRVPSKAFFLDLYEKNRQNINSALFPLYSVALSRGGADAAIDREVFMKAFFVHLLVRSEGFIGNVYEGSDEGGPAPSKLLARALSDSAPVFARCDRLEMEFKAILKEVFGIDSRIVLVSPRHVNTEIKAGNRYLGFDNSFNRWYVNKASGTDSYPVDGVYSIKKANAMARIGNQIRVGRKRAQEISVAVSDAFAHLAGTLGPNPDDMTIYTFPNPFPDW